MEVLGWLEIRKLSETQPRPQSLLIGKRGHLGMTESSWSSPSPPILQWPRKTPHVSPTDPIK